MLNRAKQAGFTLIELAIVLWGGVVLTVIGLLIWLIVHFASKFW